MHGGVKSAVVIVINERVFSNLGRTLTNATECCWGAPEKDLWDWTLTKVRPTYSRIGSFSCGSAIWDRWYLGHEKPVAYIFKSLNSIEEISADEEGALCNTVWLPMLSEVYLFLQSCCRVRPWILGGSTQEITGSNPHKSSENKTETPQVQLQNKYPAWKTHSCGCRTLREIHKAPWQSSYQQCSCKWSHTARYNISDKPRPTAHCF